MVPIWMSKRESHHQISLSKRQAEVEAVDRVHDQRQECSRAQVSMGSAPELGAAHRGTKPSLREEERNANDRGRAVGAGEDGLARSCQEHQAALPAEQEEEERKAHKLGVELACRFAERKRVHRLAVSEPSLPTKEGTVPAH